MAAQVKKSKEKKDGYHLPLFAAMKQIVTSVNCTVFFPPELGTKSIVSRCQYQANSV